MAKLSLNSVEFDITPKSLSIAHTAPSPTATQKLCHPQLYPTFLRILKVSLEKVREQLSEQRLQYSCLNITCPTLRYFVWGMGVG